MTLNLHQLLQTLSMTPAPAGLESDLATVLAEMWQPYVDEVTVDPLGNVIALKDGTGQQPRPRLLLAAHIDEIALMVRGIEEAHGHGFLRVTNVGGIDRRQLYAQRVMVHGKENVPGVLGSLPDRLLDPKRSGKAHAYEDLIVDIGLSAETARDLISVGDFITFDQPLHSLANGRVAGKALDNRACVAAVTVALDYLQSRPHAWDVIAVGTVQEETRLLGAHTTAYAQAPDAAIALDVTFGKGPGVSDAGTFDLGKGPAIDIGVNVHPGLYNELRSAAKRLEMTTHPAPHARSSGTDARGLQIARAGVPTGLISVPIRSMHTMVETAELKDVERAGRLLGEFIYGLSADFLDKVSAEMMEAA